MTAQWYKGVLSRLDENSSLLDVGIGTGAALVRNKGLVAQKKLRVVGVDYDADYVRRCAALFGEHGMQGSCAVVHQSFYDFKGLPPAAAISASSGQSDSAEAETKFDAVYFSGSLMIMPDAAGEPISCVLCSAWLTVLAPFHDSLLRQARFGTRRACFAPRPRAAST